MGYTKGNWEVEEPANEGIRARLIVGKDRELINGLIVGGEIIATVNDKANAHLIAHSPKLLKALEQLVWAVDSQGEGTIEHALTFAKSTLQTLDFSQTPAL